MKKLYVVSTEIEAVVLAESREEAEKIVDNERIHDLTSGGLSWRAQEMLWMPGGWDKECLPLGSQENDEKTIGQLIEAGAAPEYSTLLAMAKRQKKPK